LLPDYQLQQPESIPSSWPLFALHFCTKTAHQNAPTHAISRSKFQKFSGEGPPPRALEGRGTPHPFGAYGAGASTLGGAVKIFSYFKA